MDLKNAGYYFSAFRKLYHSYTDFQLSALGEYDLSPNEIVVLASLDTVITASEIACDADVSKALVSRSVKLLKEKGFITVVPSLVDKREQTLELTDTGKTVAVIINDANKRFFATALANFEGTEQEALLALLKLMMKNLSIGEWT